MTLLHHRLAVLFAIWVVVVYNAASALQVQGRAVVDPLQRILPAPKSSNFFKNNHHNNIAAPLHRPNKVPAFTKTKLDASVAFDDESYSSGGGGAGLSNKRRHALIVSTATAVASSRMIRWPILGALILLAMRQANPVVLPLLKSLIQSYDQCMVARPLLTKVLTGAVLATLGDALAQSRTSSTSTTATAAAVRYDPRRAASFAAFDSCYRCFQHYAFPTVISTCRGNFLGRFVSFLFTASTPLSAESLHLLAVAERTLVYQLAVVPLLYYPVFFLFTGFMQGLNLQQTLERAKNNFIPCWKRNLLFWIPVQTLMFGWIKEQWQIPFVCVMGILWSSILSITAGKATATKKKDT